MLRELLVDRFRLQFHLNSQNAPIYALIVDKGGLKVQQRSAQNDDNPWIDTAAKPEPGQPLEIKWHATASSMMYFAFRLSQILDRPVIDRTGLDARYDFDLTFSRERPEGIPSGAIFIGDPKHKSDSTIFDAVRRQLGLGLEPQKGPVEVMVIDHADRPTEN